MVLHTSTTRLPPSDEDLITLATNFELRAPAPTDTTFKRVGGELVPFDGYGTLKHALETYHMLPERHVTMLNTLAWFPMYADAVLLSNETNLSTVSADTIVNLIAFNFPLKVPELNDVISTTNSNNEKVLFYPLRALRRLSLCWNHKTGPSMQAKDLISRLPWFAQWKEAALQNKGRVARRARQVSKSSKVQMLQIFYPLLQPGWRDEIPMLLEDNSVWVFRPTQFLDDVSCVWLDGKSVLSEEDKASLEKLPWLMPWIHSIAKKRIQRKRPRPCELALEAPRAPRAALVA